MNLNTVDSTTRRFEPVNATPALDPVQEDGRTRRRHAAEDEDHQRHQRVGANERGEREFKQQRHALVEGVVTAFFPQGAGLPGSTDATGTPGSTEGTAPVAEAHPSDQNLEKAILRFVHAVFDTLRDYESAKAEGGAGAGAGAEGASAVGGAHPSHHHGGRGSKTPLSDGLSAMARDYAAAGQAGSAAASTAPAAAVAAAGSSGAARQADPASAEPKTGTTLPEKPEIPDPRLASTYAEVVQALRSGASTSSDVRVELAALLQRLAQALRGDQGGSRAIPAVGSLVSTRV